MPTDSRLPAFHPAFVEHVLNLACGSGRTTVSQFDGGRRAFGGEVSADGKWMAYHSNESGEFQVIERNARARISRPRRGGSRRHHVEGSGDDEVSRY
jgi:hypothetical protein